jgi:hypothetical protein
MAGACNNQERYCGYSDRYFWTMWQAGSIDRGLVFVEKKYSSWLGEEERLTKEEKSEANAKEHWA